MVDKTDETYERAPAHVNIAWLSQSTLSLSLREEIMVIS
jgi:hypothetical protein